MSKGLEALEVIKEHLTRYNDTDDIRGIDYENEVNVIETALKRLETLEEEKQSFDRQLEKKLKALEIIKKRFTIQFYESDLPSYYGVMQIGINPIYIKTQQEYDLLKEVLL